MDGKIEVTIEIKEKDLKSYGVFKKRIEKNIPKLLTKKFYEEFKENYSKLLKKIEGSPETQLSDEEFKEIKKEIDF